MDSRIFLGKITYLQFIDAGISEDIELLRRVLFEWRDSPLQVIVVAKDTSILNGPMGIGAERLLFVSDPQNKIRERFTITQGHHYLVDARGDIIFSMGNEFGYSDSLKYSLNKAIFGIEFEPSVLVAEGLQLSECDWFASLAS